MNAKEYYAGLLKEAGVADDQQQAFLGILDNEAVAKKLQDDLVAPKLRHDEFSRKMDDLAKQKQENDQKAQEYYLKSTNEFNAYHAALEALGTNPDNGAPKPNLITTPTDAISRKDFEAELAKRDQQTLALMKTGLNLVGRHYKEFQEPLDTETLAKTALEKGLSLEQAYDQSVASRRADAQAAKYKADLEAAKLEGARDFASKHKIPVDTAPRDPSPIQNNLLHKPPQAENQFERETRLRNSFADAWNQQPAPTSGG